MKTIKIQDKSCDYATISSIADEYDFSCANAALRHLEAHGIDHTLYRIRERLNPSSRQALGLPTKSSVTILYSTEICKWLKTPRPLKPCKPSIESNVKSEYSSRKFLR